MGQAFWTGVRLPSSPPEYSKDCKRKILQSFFIVLGNVIKKGESLREVYDFPKEYIILCNIFL